jgi:hypothetical protein
LDFFDDRGVLMLPGFFFAFGLFVTEFSDLHDTAYGWGGRCGNFHEVNAVLSRERERVIEREDAELFLAHDDADLAGADFAVDPEKRHGRGIA